MIEGCIQEVSASRATECVKSVISRRSRETCSFYLAERKDLSHSFEMTHEAPMCLSTESDECEGSKISRFARNERSVRRELRLRTYAQGEHGLIRFLPPRRGKIKMGCRRACASRPLPLPFVEAERAGVGKPHVLPLFFKRTGCVCLEYFG